MTNKDLEIAIMIKEAELAGLKAMFEGCEEKNEEPEKEVKKPARGRKAAKAKPEPEVEEETEEEAGADDYESMTSTALYKLCCERGISSKCKKRDKKTLIAVLKENDAAQDDEWEDEEEQDTDPYAGKTAKELYKMCKDRGLAATPKKPADVYAKILKKADAEAAKKANTKAQVEEEEDDEDDWEI